jgi:hypothetical protein
VTRYIKLFVCLTTLYAGVALAQRPTDEFESSRSPVAKVYVSTMGAIQAFDVSSSGRLTRIPGSPFPATVESLSATDKYLFGSGYNGDTNLYSFSIAADGSVHEVSKIDAQPDDPSDCGGLGPVQIDYAGKTLYNKINSFSGCTNLTYQSFAIGDTGALQFLGSTQGPTNAPGISYSQLHLVGNDRYAYVAGSLDNGVEFERQGDGLLTYVDKPIALPTPKDPARYSYSAYSALAVDPVDHLALALEEYANSSPDSPISMLLASYTSGKNGQLSTTSSFKNMPSADVTFANTMSISPTGKLLAVGGNGFQVFHFNGSEPITSFTAVHKPDDLLREFAWDSHDHLYALAVNANTAVTNLLVYTVTPTSITEAPGSPYTIPGASSVVVLAPK